MISAASLRVTVGSDVRDAIAGLGRVDRAVSDTAGAFRQGVGAAVGFAAGVLGLNGLGSVADGLNAAIFGMNNTLQGAGISFTTMLKSGERAGVMLDTIKEFAKTTPFDLPQVLAGAKNLLAYGFSAEQVIPLLRDMGNVSAGLDLGAEGISRITRALGQMRAKGRVTQEDLNQLQEVGINTNAVFAMMAKNMGKTVPQLKKMQEAGKLDSGAFLVAFQQFSQANFGGLMDAQSRTLVGAMSNIRDALGQTGADAFLPFFQLVQDGALRLSTFLSGQEFATWAAAVKTHVGAASQDVRTFLQTVQNISTDHGLSRFDAAIITTENAIKESLGTGWSGAFHGFIDTVKRLGRYSLQEELDYYRTAIAAVPGRLQQDLGLTPSGFLAGAGQSNSAMGVGVRAGQWLHGQMNPGGLPGAFDPAAARNAMASQTTNNTLNFYGPVGQNELNQIDALLGAQGEVAAMASPDAPGQ